MKRPIVFYVIAALLAATLLFGCASDTLNSVSVEAAARSDEQAEETWLYIDCYGLCTVTNAEGKTLVCDVGIPSGDLAFSDRRYTIDGGVNGCAVALFRVEESGSFTFSTEADSAGFAVIWNGFRQDISGTGIQQVVFTPSSVQTAGVEMDYTLDVSAAADALRSVTVNGSATSAVTYRGQSDVEIKADAPCTVAVCDTAIDPPLLTFDVPSNVTAVVKDAATARIRYGLSE